MVVQFGLFEDEEVNLVVVPAGQEGITNPHATALNR